MWQDDFLDEIRKVDYAQVPHGLYGMREALADEFRTKGARGLPSIAKLLGSKDPRTGIAQRLGWSYSAVSGNVISFSPPRGTWVAMEVESHASTKVRHYGDSYVLDKVHGKKPEENADFLESLVPSTGKKGFNALLFIAHVPTPQRFAKLLGKTNDPAFLERYQLGFHSQEWEDIRRRGFHTGLFLWVSNPGREQPA